MDNLRTVRCTRSLLLTGITAAKVAGHRIDLNAVTEFVSDDKNRDRTTRHLTARLRNAAGLNSKIVTSTGCSPERRDMTDSEMAKVPLAKSAKNIPISIEGASILRPAMCGLHFRQNT